MHKTTLSTGFFVPIGPIMTRIIYSALTQISFINMGSIPMSERKKESRLPVATHYMATSPTCYSPIWLYIKAVRWVFLIAVSGSTIGIKSTRIPQLLYTGNTPPC